jgi:predicted HAD superfamily Cof-like phosphohydrolase
VSHFKEVGAFMSTFGQDTNKTFTHPDHKIVKLRLELICEEFKEVFKEVVTSGSSGMVGCALLTSMSSLINELQPGEISINFPNLAKELVDLEYVILGAGHAFGVNLDAVFDEVQRSNMSKLGEDGKPIYRDDGKVMKGPNYSAADAELALFNAGCYPLPDDYLEQTFHDIPGKQS